MLVDEFLERTAARDPDKTAVVAGNRRVTYGELERESNQLAHALLDRGLERYDRVAIFLDNCWEAAVAIFATLKAGGVFTVVNATTKSDRLATVLNDCRATAIIVDPIRKPRLDDVADRVAHLRITIGTLELGEVCAGQPATRPRARNIDVDLAALTYTSGSTGGPKAVMMTHLGMASAASSIIEYLHNTADDVVLDVLPLSFGYGLYQLLMMVKVGGTVVLENGFSYPHRVLELMAREGVTGFPVVPTITAILLQMDVRKYQLPSLRYITNAGAALPIAQARALRAAFPSTRIFAMYGQTECTRVAYLPPEQLDERPTSCGVPIPNEEVWIVGEDGQEVPPGGIGELVVRGSHVMAGYWERPEQTARVLRPGRIPGERVLYTGDLFRRDADGYLYFISRKDDIIKTRGQKVAPCEVEEVLLAMAAIAEAAVVGVPDAVLGAAVKAVVTLRPGEEATELDIRRHCADRLEDFMVPRYIEIRAELPRSAHGKIAKTELVQA